MKKVYYKEFKSTAEMQKFISRHEIKEKNIIDSKFVTRGLVCMWHYVEINEENNVFDKAIKYIRDNFCDQYLHAPYVLLGNVAELIKITTGKEINYNELMALLSINQLNKDNSKSKTIKICNNYSETSKDNSNCKHCHNDLKEHF